LRVSPILGDNAGQYDNGGQRQRVNEKTEKTPAHLSVRPDGDGPVEVRFLFEQPDAQRLGGALGVGAVTHVVLLIVVLIIASLIPERVRDAFVPEPLSAEIVWLSDPGPGGGGGGGNEMPEPPKAAEAPGEEEITVPVPPEPTPEPTPEPPPLVEPLNIAALTLASATTTSPGAVSAPVSDSLSLGSGTGSGAGEGRGSGLGPGTGGGSGGGAYRPGNGVLPPRVLEEVKPQYTAEAMRAKVQGRVMLECIVLADGTVGNVEVLRSLDPTFGLDQEAIKAAKQWRFDPGTRFGEPVAVLVTIELTFTLR
jgi:TonB family protein